MEEKKDLERKEFRITDEEGNIIGDLIDIAYVTDPAIEINTQMFAKETKKQTFKTLEERMEITGPVMIPNKDILRYDQEFNEYFYCYFTEDTVRKCLQIYMENCNHVGSKLEHLGLKNKELYTFESWIIEDPENDKANALGWTGLNKGTWMASIKVKSPELWKELKDSDFKGFSIEGSFGIFKTLLDKHQIIEEDLEDIVDDLFLSKKEKKDAVKSIVDFYSFVNVNELSFNDYPQAATDNAKRALKWRATTQNPKGCGTQVGWRRANQLAKRESISYSTVKRMAAFIRHEQNSNVPYEEGCGKLAWDLWGGTEGIAWAIRKVQQIEKLIEEENMKKQKK